MALPIIQESILHDNEKEKDFYIRRIKELKEYIKESNSSLSNLYIKELCELQCDAYSKGCISKIDPIDILNYTRRIERK